MPRIATPSCLGGRPPVHGNDNGNHNPLANDPDGVDAQRTPRTVARAPHRNALKLLGDYLVELRTPREVRVQQHNDSALGLASGQLAAVVASLQNGDTDTAQVACFGVVRALGRYQGGELTERIGKVLDAYRTSGLAAQSEEALMELDANLHQWAPLVPVEDDSAEADVLAQLHFSVKAQLLNLKMGLLAQEEERGDDGQSNWDGTFAKTLMDLKHIAYQVRALAAPHRLADDEDLPGTPFTVAELRDVVEEVQCACALTEKTALAFVNARTSAPADLSLRELKQVAEAIHFIRQHRERGLSDSDSSDSEVQRFAPLESALAAKLFGADFKKTNTKDLSNLQLVELRRTMARLPYVPEVLQVLKGKIDDRIELRQQKARDAIQTLLHNEVLAVLRVPDAQTVDKLLGATLLVMAQVNVFIELGGSRLTGLSNGIGAFVQSEKASGADRLRRLHLRLTTGDGLALRKALVAASIDRLKEVEDFLESLTEQVNAVMRPRPTPSAVTGAPRLSSHAVKALAGRLAVVPSADFGGLLVDVESALADARREATQALADGYDKDPSQIRRLTEHIKLLVDVAKDDQALVGLAPFMRLCKSLSEFARFQQDGDAAESAEELFEVLLAAERRVAFEDV